MKTKKLPKPLDLQLFKSVCECAAANMLTPDDLLRLSSGLVSREPFLLEYEKIQGRHEIDRFLSILSELYAKSPRRFEEAAITVRGSKRIYFARTAGEVSETGNSNKAEKIPGSPWWVSANNDGHHKRNIAIELMQKMGLSREYASMVSGLCGGTAPSIPFPYSRILFELSESCGN